MRVPQKMNDGIVRILLWSIVKSVSTGAYILVYSYLDFRASRFTESDKNRTHTLGHAYYD